MDSAPDSGPKHISSEPVPEQKKLFRMPHILLNPTPLTKPLNRKLLKGSHFYTLVMTVAILCIPILFALLAWDFYDRTHHPEPPYYAPTVDDYEKMTQTGRLEITTKEQYDREVMPVLRHPNLSTSVLLNWAGEAATTAYTFDFYNYQQVLQDIRSYFTQAGYDNFLAALQSSGTIRDVVSKKLVVSCVMTGNPIILKEGETPDGSYAWQVQFPLLITYQSASELAKQNMVLNLLIATVPTTESPKGIGIASFVVRPRGA